MSRRGKEKKQKHVAKVHAQKAARAKEKQPAAEPKKRLQGRALMGMLPPWKRKLMESFKKRKPHDI